MWTAPELLRIQNRPPEGTQKGDVYSWSIISQEIIYRNGVFYTTNNEMGSSGKQFIIIIIIIICKFFTQALADGLSLERQQILSSLQDPS